VVSRNKNVYKFVKYNEQLQTENIWSAWWLQKFLHIFLCSCISIVQANFVLSTHKWKEWCKINNTSSWFNWKDLNWICGTVLIKFEIIVYIQRYIHQSCKKEWLLSLFVVISRLNCTYNIYTHCAIFVCCPAGENIHWNLLHWCEKWLVGQWGMLATNLCVINSNAQE
jgi:hypothetical protein